MGCVYVFNMICSCVGYYVRGASCHKRQWLMLKMTSAFSIKNNGDRKAFKTVVCVFMCRPCIKNIAMPYPRLACHLYCQFMFAFFLQILNV